MRTVERSTVRPVQQQFESLSSSYRFECAHGIPTSVRKRYELRLARIREELRAHKTSCYLGEVLKLIGALDQRRLTSALTLQKENGGQKLLGEILIDLGWVDEETIRRAVDIQRIGATNRPGDRHTAESRSIQTA